MRDKETLAMNSKMKGMMDNDLSVIKEKRP